MSRYLIPLLAGVIWVAGLALAADPEPPKPKPPAAPAAPGAPAAPAAPATQPTVHPIRTQTSFVVEPKDIKTTGGVTPLGPITVTLNYFDKLPGLDLDKLSPKRRQAVLDRANKEACTCGCKGDTVARCLVNDPNCKLVKSLAAQIYEEEKLRPETK